MRKVVLIGYMGCGKSTVSKMLAVKTGITAIELDEMIEEKCRMSVEEIFLCKGEIFFRKIEHDLFLELMNSEEDLIISTGGGTPCYYDNHKLLNKKDVISVYLRASVEILFERLILEKQKRPLIAHLNNNEIKEFIAKHLFDRNFYYNQANFKVTIDKKSLKIIVNEISQLLIQ